MEFMQLFLCLLNFCFWVCQFNILDYLNYFFACHTLVFKLFNQINNFLACHVFTFHPLSPAFLMGYHHYSRFFKWCKVLLFNFQGAFFVCDCIIHRIRCKVKYFLKVFAPFSLIY